MNSMKSEKAQPYGCVFLVYESYVSAHDAKGSSAILWKLV